MGYGKWERHVIINTQPTDGAASTSAAWLERKPTRDQAQERRTYNFDGRFQLESKQTDKVYVVGHGDRDKSTLGGQQPEWLANELKEGVQNCQQLNLVMCGTSDLELARRFALQLFRNGYAGKVYAYETTITVDREGKKHGVMQFPTLARLNGKAGAEAIVSAIKAEFDKESFAEQFAAEAKQNEELLEFLRGGESEPNVAASDDGEKSEHGSLLEK